MKHKLLVDATADFICQGLQPLSVSLANQPPPVRGRPFICGVMHAFISLMAHFADRDFKHHSKCLQTLEIAQDHDAISLKGVPLS